MLYMFIVILFASFVATAADIEINLKPKNGTLKTTIINKKKEKSDFVEASFAFQSTARKSFKASTKVDIKNWSHYASISFGFRNSKYDDMFSMKLSKGDNGKRSAIVKIKLARGMEYTGRPFAISPKIKSIIFTYEYDMMLNKFNLVISSNDENIYETGWQKIRGHFSIDEFFVQAKIAKKNKAVPPSSIKWDENKQAVHVISQTGKSYIIDLIISKVTISQD